MYNIHPDIGWLEVITGCMYSGKSEELVARLRRAKYTNLKIKAFKPKIDNRYAKSAIASHNTTEFEAQAIETLDEVDWENLDADVIGIDEVQFFDPEIVTIIQKLADSGKRVIVAGLDLDYNGKPFGCTPSLMAIADNLCKKTAVCTVCGRPATRSQRITSQEGKVLVGSHGMYEARCRKHHFVKEEE